jgi:phage shock protein PspC (stress-responsive transcriptional regulator)
MAESVIPFIIALLLAFYFRNEGVRRPSSEASFAGVCAGLGRRYDLSANSVRWIFVLLFLLAGVGPLTYILCALILPKD